MPQKITLLSDPDGQIKALPHEMKRGAAIGEPHIKGGKQFPNKRFGQSPQKWKLPKICIMTP